MGRAEEGHEVVFARGVDRDVAHQDELLVVFRERLFQHVGRLRVQAREDLLVGAGHARRGFGQALAVGVLADGD